MKEKPVPPKPSEQPIRSFPKTINTPTPFSGVKPVELVFFRNVGHGVCHYKCPKGNIFEVRFPQEGGEPYIEYS